VPSASPPPRFNTFHEAAAIDLLAGHRASHRIERNGAGTKD